MFDSRLFLIGVMFLADPYSDLKAKAASAVLKGMPVSTKVLKMLTGEGAITQQRNRSVHCSDTVYPNVAETGVPPPNAAGIFLLQSKTMSKHC